MRSSYTSATRDNAMTGAEIDAFLAEPRIGRLASLRDDGGIDVTPVWFDWDGQTRCVMFNLGERRRHVRNLLRNPNATICVDEDPRPRLGFEAGARGVVLRGHVELSDDVSRVMEGLSRIGPKYLGAAALDPSTFPQEALLERRYYITLRAAHISSWDFAKAAARKD